jgi:hypothetical protein
LIIVDGKTVSATMKSRNHSGKRKGSANEAARNVQGKRTAEAIVDIVPTDPGGGSVLRENTNTQQEPTRLSPTIQPPTTTSRRFVVGGGQPMRVLSSMVTVNPTALVVPEQGDMNVKAWFEACQNSGRLNNTAMLHKDISSYVRYDLFPNLKFIMAKTQMEYSTDPTTLCAIICSAMGMADPSTAVTWWEHWKDMIADVLNAKRADVTGAIKKVFVRKYLHQK